MKLWEIIVPTKDNDGKSYARADSAFRAELLAVWGGFTHYNVYRIACNGTPALASVAAEYFPDQLAFFIADLGEADIWNRPQPVRIVA